MDSVEWTGYVIHVHSDDIRLVRLYWIFVTCSCSVVNTWH